MDDFSARFAAALGDYLPDIAARLRPEAEGLFATLPSPSGRGTLRIETESDNVRR